MTHVLARHKVENFEKWKAVYDSDSEARRQAGLHEVFVLRNVSEPLEVFVLAKVDDLAKAHAYSDTPGLMEKMIAAGVTDRPDIVYLA
jgi:hypothetical protein